MPLALPVLATNKQSKYVMQCGMHSAPARWIWIHKSDHKLNIWKLQVKFRLGNGLNNKSESILPFNNDIEVFQAQSESLCFKMITQYSDAALLQSCRNHDIVSLHPTLLGPQGLCSFDGSEVRSSGCSFRGPVFNSQWQHGAHNCL